MLAVGYILQKQHSKWLNVMWNDTCCAEPAMNGEEQKFFQSTSASSVLDDKSIATRCWLDTITKYSEYVDETRQNFQGMIGEFKRKGCLKGDFSDQCLHDLKRASVLVKENEDVLNKIRFDMYVLNFAPEHGELLYKEVKKYDFYEENNMQPDSRYNKRIAEAIDLIKSDREREKKDTEDKKHKSVLPVWRDRRK